MNEEQEIFLKMLASFAYIGTMVYFFIKFLISNVTSDAYPGIALMLLALVGTYICLGKKK